MSASLPLKGTGDNRAMKERRKTPQPWNLFQVRKRNPEVKWDAVLLTAAHLLLDGSIAACNAKLAAFAIAGAVYWIGA